MNQRAGASSIDADLEKVDTDVCIVGAGPAGITIARELGSHGVRVCLLEGGGRDPARRWQRQARGESSGYPIHLLHQSRMRVFGGSLRHPSFGDAGWAARPLDPIDFETRQDRPESGWPFDRHHLDPFYVRSETACGLPSFDLAEQDWLKAASGEGRDVESSPDLETTVYQFPRPAFHDAWDELAALTHVRVLLETRAVETRRHETSNRVASILAVRSTGERLLVRACQFVFAAGGIENARLLLTADGGASMGNEHDLVGRYFAERLWFHAGHVVLSESTTVEELDCFYHRENEPFGGGLRVADFIQRDQGLLNVAFFMVPRPAAVTSPAVRSATTLRKAAIRRPVVPGLGLHARNVVLGAQDLLGLARGGGARVLALRAQGEQAPNRNSRVTLGSRTDDLGIPVARVAWRMAPEDLESVERSAMVLDGALRSRGLGYVEWTARPGGTTLIEGLHHHLGTTRMHVDPAQGVVDPHSRVHSIDNLYVAGCSVFPTYGASNPTFTIVALALRLADRLREVLGTAG